MVFKEEKGTIIIITLWILAILIIFATGLGYRMGLELKLAGYQLSRLKVLYLAKAGLRKAMVELKNDTNNYDTLQDSWSNNETAFREIELGEGKFTISYFPHQEEDEEPVSIYGIQDEESKININKASMETLIYLLMKSMDKQQSTEIAAAIIDWRDEDNNPEEGGAENNYYQSLAVPYSCKNAVFETIEELLFVRGITPELLTRLKDTITIYGKGKVNVNTAGENALQALGKGLSLITPEADENTAEELAKRIVRFRQQAEETEKDEYIFKNLEEINEKLNDFEGGTVGSGENNLINALKPQLTVTSNNFKIQVKASLNNDKIIKQVTAVVERQKDKKTIIRYWYEN